MKQKNIGLYNQKFEHDACGIGCIANIKGKKSHNTIKSAIEILKNLAHRGGVGAEIDTGDGAGILIQIPHKFFEKVCKNEKINLPRNGQYGVGMLFLSPDKETREESIRNLSQIIKSENQINLNIRKVPVNPYVLGKSAFDAMPYIVQVFIGKADRKMTDDEFERRLYIIRRRAEKEIRDKQTDNYFYFASLSSKTIVYKGMLTPSQVTEFYLDLKDTDMQTAIALVHSRFSTNTFPSWERAHPNRYIVHNGEINTIGGNVNWVKARESMFYTSELKNEMDKILPVIDENGSDSSMLDNYLQFLHISGFSLPRAVMMTIPEPWENNERMDDNLKAFYEYHSCMTEAWDGPTAIAFTDGRIVGATLDRNGLRPARYYVTDDDMLILSSEAGVMDIEEERIIKKERLHPGKMLLVDTKKGKIISDTEIKEYESQYKPYKKWLKSSILELKNIEDCENGIGRTWKDLIFEIENDEKNNSKRLVKEYAKIFNGRENFKEEADYVKRLNIFGYTREDIEENIIETVNKGAEPIYAMGCDIPLAVMSKRPQLLYNYFKQLFAQVTNPPIDAIREEIVTSSYTYFGAEENLLVSSEKNCRKIRAQSPLLSDNELNRIRNIDSEGFKSITIPMLFNVKEGNMSDALEDIFRASDIAIKNGYNIIILSDRGVNKDIAPIPALLAAAGLHHHLVREANRMKVSIIVESAEVREVHHFACLLGYGVNGINPYMVYEIIEKSTRDIELSKEEAINRFNNAMTKGIVKVMSKMGISTIQSYQGAQIFEALGISESVVDKFFTGTVSRIGGIGLDYIEEETLMRHTEAFDKSNYEIREGGEYKWRQKGEYHIFNPSTIYKLQTACRTGDYELYKEYAKEMNSYNDNECTIRSMLNIRTNDKPIALDRVESVESIVRRFKTGAMSYGSISKEAHECIAIAMNRIGGKSNSGEGGEDKERFKVNEGQENSSSAIKQVASGRFGVDIHYLNNAKEIQIKMAQGAKPGEGGHLPGNKVYPWIAKIRNSTPGVGLISPPPHHDIYSIEDLSELIHDLKNANKDARIAVKLVSEAGVGTIAAGVAKGRADVILVSGYDGGTGAAPRTSVRHAGLPWEMGVAEVHQTLIMNNLRNRVVLETDGKLLTGRDVLVAALLGAEEFGFSTGVLIAMGCVMMRVCNLDTCPVGIATQNPDLRNCFSGKPEYVENFMKFIARDLREWMARIGVRTVQEMIGAVEKLYQKSATNKKVKTIDLSQVLYCPDRSDKKYCYHNTNQNHELDKELDMSALLRICEKSITEDKVTNAKLEIKNINRVTGTLLSSEIVRQRGENEMKDDTICLDFTGTAGQSFGAFLAKGITLKLFGDANDYIGKGLSGGKIIVVPKDNSKLNPCENVIIGNVSFYGATKGEAYIYGMSGERFCVRNSGISAVTESVGDHGCEYMTGGMVAILGSVGRNFAAGMSGGIAYVYDRESLKMNCNRDMKDCIEELDDYDRKQLTELLEKYYKNTNSKTAKKILENSRVELKKFMKVIPRDYKNIMAAIEKEMKNGAEKDTAMLNAFENQRKGV